MWKYDNELQIKILRLGQYGCYALCLAWIVNDWSTRQGKGEVSPFTAIEGFIDSYGLIYNTSSFYFVRDAEKCLSHVTKTNWTIERQSPTIVTPPDFYEVLDYRKSNNDQHFVIGDRKGNVIFDPSNALRQPGWTLTSKRWIKEIT